MSPFQTHALRPSPHTGALAPSRRRCPGPLLNGTLKFMFRVADVRQTQVTEPPLDCQPLHQNTAIVWASLGEKAVFQHP